MKRLLSAAKENVIYNKLAYFYGALFSINSLATAIVASFMNVEWSDLSATSKILLLIVVLQNWTGTMLAFVNRTMARAQAGEPLVPTGDTTLTVKTTATTTVPTTTPNP